MDRHRGLHTRLTACGAVLTRTAVALIHIEITVASKTRCVGLQMRCHPTIVVSTIALLHIALTRILHNEAVRWILAITHIALILTHTVREPSHTCALVRMV